MLFFFQYRRVNTDMSKSYYRQMYIKHLCLYSDIWIFFC